MIGDRLRELRIKAAGVPITNSSDQDRRRTVVRRLNDAQTNLEELDLAPYDYEALWRPADANYPRLLLDLQRMQSLVAQESWRSYMSLDEIESATDVMLEKLHKYIGKDRKREWICRTETKEKSGI
jgi:hypothetical protein